MAAKKTKQSKKTTVKTDKRSAPKKRKQPHPIMTELRNLVLLVVSVILLSCLIFPMGNMGHAIRDILFGVFGPFGAIALPASFAAVLFFGRRLRANRVVKAKLIFAVISVVSMMGALHLITRGIPDHPGFIAFISSLWMHGKAGIGGGVLGGSLAWLVAVLTGRYLSVAILILISAIGFSFAAGSTGWGLWVFIADMMGINPNKEREKKNKKGKSARKNAASTISMEEIAQIRATAVGADAVASAQTEETPAIAEESISFRSLTRPNYTDTSEIKVSSAAADIISANSGSERPSYTSAPITAARTVQSVSVGTDVIPPVAERERTVGQAAERYDIGADRTVSSTMLFTDMSSDTESTKSVEYADSIRAATDIAEEYDAESAYDPEDGMVIDEADDLDDYDDIDGDPFADQPDKKERLMDKLFRKDSKMKDLIRDNKSEDTVPQAAEPASYRRAAQQEPEPPQDDGVKRWTTGDRYAYPSTELLNPIAVRKTVSEEEVNAVAEKILRKLASFKVSASLVGYSVGPSITRYELAPGEGVRVNKISQLITDISLELASEGVRIEAPIPRKAAVGIEVPNKKVSIVSFRSLVENSEFMKAKSKITVCVGQNVTGDAVFMDIDDMPHVLIAGQTKSGKSVAINCMLLSLLFRVTPDEVKLILVDPKRVELNIYGRLPHLIAPVVDDPTKAAAVLSWAVKEMERRYDLMGRYSARNRDEYRKRISGKPDTEDFPQIVIVIDELADLMLQVREHVEPLINRLAAKARACGIHLLIGTQRPSVDVLTGLIKANIPARISFKVAEQVDSRTIIGTVGAEKLLGRGDMLYQPTGSARVRIQGAYVDGEEINRVVDYIVENNGEATYDPDIIAQIDEEAKNLLPTKKRGGGIEDDEPFDREKKLDPMFYNAVEIAVQNQSISTSSLQRYLEIGYGRAAKLIDTMEKMGIAGPPNGSKPRAIFMDMDQYQVWRLDQRFD